MLPVNPAHLLSLVHSGMSSRYSAFMRNLRNDILAAHAFPCPMLSRWPPLVREIQRIRSRDWYNADPPSDSYVPCISRFPPPGPRAVPDE